MYGVTPDIITTAKALGAGFPVSALLMADHVASYLKTDTLGTTFGGGPMACTIVETVIDIIESEKLLENVRAALGGDPRDSASSARSSRRRAPGCCSACALRGPRRTCRRSC